jgi:hypothetical protein
VPWGRKQFRVRVVSNISSRFFCDKIRTTAIDDVPIAILQIWRRGFQKRREREGGGGREGKVKEEYFTFTLGVEHLRIW